jgi:HK97 gp10 family phage protein
MNEPVVHGMRELFDTLSEFPEKLQRSTIAKVVRAGGRIVATAARQRVPVGETGKLKRSIRVRISRRGGRWTATVAAGRNRKKDDPFYATMVERGTKAHEIRPKGAKSLFLAGIFREVVQHPGADPKPFLGPALEENIEQIVDAMQDELRLEVTMHGWFR